MNNPHDSPKAASAREPGTERVSPLAAAHLSCASGGRRATNRTGRARAKAKPPTA